MEKVLNLLETEIKSREDMIDFNKTHKNVVSDYTAKEANEMIVELKEAIKILTSK